VKGNIYSENDGPVCSDKFKHDKKSFLELYNAIKYEKYYFEYLNNKTFMTKEFVKSNWNKLILVDYSHGQSICGASIFFNRYIENITTDDMCDITGSVPMKFINLANSYYLNLDPLLAKKYFEKYNINTEDRYYNYDPNFIINLGYIYFAHYVDFIIRKTFPRYVPVYPPSSWTEEPKFEQEGLKQIEKLSELYECFNNFNSDSGYLIKTLDLLKSMPKTSKRIVNYVYTNDSDLKKVLNKYFREISEKLIMFKCDNVYQS